MLGTAGDDVHMKLSSPARWKGEVRFSYVQLVADPIMAALAG